MFFYSEQVGSVDPYAANVSFFLEGEGADQGTSFLDSGINNYSITRVRNTTTSTTLKKSGNSSIYFTGGNESFSDHYSSADYLYAADAYNVITTGSFTIEAWIYKTNSNRWGTICGTFSWNTGNNSGWSLFIGPDNKIYLGGSNGGWNSVSDILVSTSTISLNTWNHVAVTRDSSNNIRCFIDGQLCGTTSNYSNTLNLASNNGGINGASIKRLNVGGYPSDSYIKNAFVGHIDNLKITTGVARYTANFTPPDAL